jgi:hypothetical protein
MDTNWLRLWFLQNKYLMTSNIWEFTVAICLGANIDFKLYPCRCLVSINTTLHSNDIDFCSKDCDESSSSEQKLSELERNVILINMNWSKMHLSCNDNNEFVPISKYSRTSHGHPWDWHVLSLIEWCPEYRGQIEWNWLGTEALYP